MNNKILPSKRCLLKKINANMLLGAWESLFILAPTRGGTVKNPLWHLPPTTKSIFVSYICLWQIKSSVLDMLSFSQLCTSIWDPYHQLSEILCSGCDSLFGLGVGGRQVGFALTNNIVHFVDSVDCFSTTLYFWNRFFSVGFQPSILVF